MSKRLGRRSALQTLLVGTSALAFGRLLDACSDASTSDRLGAPAGNPPAPPPNDGDEFVPGKGDPVNTGDTPPTLPNNEWEARARQLEDQQKQRYGSESFTATSPGPFPGKERSHVPTATTGKTPDGKYAQVTVLVNHVMGANGLDAGPAYDASTDASDAGKADASDGGDAGKADAGDAGDAGKLDAGDASAEGGADAGPVEVHYITTIYLRAVVNGMDTVVGLWEFKSTDAAPPAAAFTLPAGVTSVTAYEWCTLHGLWKSDPIATT